MFVFVVPLLFCLRKHKKVCANFLSVIIKKEKKIFIFFEAFFWYIEMDFSIQKKKETLEFSTNFHFRQNNKLTSVERDILTHFEFFENEKSLTFFF